MLDFKGRWKPVYLEKNLAEQEREPTEKLNLHMAYADNMIK